MSRGASAIMTTKTVSKEAKLAGQIKALEKEVAVAIKAADKADRAADKLADKLDKLLAKHEGRGV